MSEFRTTDEERDALREQVELERPELPLTIVAVICAQDLLTLDDLLLSLEAQSSENFELSLVCDGLDRPGASAVRASVARFANGLCERTEFFETSVCAERPREGALGSDLSALVRHAAKVARGRHILFVDGQAVFFGDLAETFARAGSSSPGMVLRSVGAEQCFEETSYPDGSRGFVALQAPETPWSASYDAISELAACGTPLGTFALPRRALEERFAEYIRPDLPGWAWELFIRVAFELGVQETNCVTTLRRRWPSAADVESRQRHLERDEVGRRLDGTPLLLPPMGVASIRAMFDSLAALSSRVDEIETERSELLVELEAMQGRLERARSLDGDGFASTSSADQLEAELAAMRSSTSWRITAPLRGAVNRWRYMQSEVRKHRSLRIKH